MPHIRTNWANYQSPAINALNLNNIEDGIWYSLVHSGGVRNTAEFLDRNPGSTTGGLAEAVTDLGGSPGVVFAAPHNHPINVNYPVPANVHLIAGRGATFTVANGITLTINGTLEAGLYQIFSWVGTGKVVFGDGSVSEVFVEWWGAVANDTFNCTDAINAALIESTTRPARLSDGIYRHDGTINFESGYTLIGNGRARSVLKYYGAAEGIKNDTVLTDYPVLKGFKLEDAGTGTIGLALGHCRHGQFGDILVSSFDTNISIDKTTGVIANYYNTFRDVISYNAATTGWLLGSATGGCANANWFYGCKSWDDPVALHIVCGAGNHFYGMHMEGANTFIDIDLGNENIINAYLERAVGGAAGDAAAGTYGNRLNLLYDGGMSDFVDNGWNMVTGDEVHSPVPLKRHLVEIVDRYDTGYFIAVAKNVFKITLPSINAAYKVVLTLAGHITGVDNYAGVQVYDLTRESDLAAVVTLVTTTNDNQFTTAVAAGEVTFIVPGHAVAESRYQIGVHILGVGATNAGVLQFVSYDRL